MIEAGQWWDRPDGSAFRVDGVESNEVCYAAFAPGAKSADGFWRMPVCEFEGVLREHAMTRRPWAYEDAPLHRCADGKQGPILPAVDARPAVMSTAQVSRLRCLACGEEWGETDVHIVAWAWWSHGAWVQQDHGGNA